MSFYWYPWDTRSGFYLDCFCHETVQPPKDSQFLWVATVHLELILRFPFPFVGLCALTSFGIACVAVLPKRSARTSSSLVERQTYRMGFYSSMRSGIPDPEVELDLTNSHLHSLEEVEIRPTLEVCYS
jgi:hypothetical protein